MSYRLANAQPLLAHKPKDGPALEKAYIKCVSTVVYSGEASNDVKIEELQRLTDGFQYLKHRHFWRKKND